MAAPTYAQTFPSGTVEYYLKSSLDLLPGLAPPAHSIVITDEAVQALHGARWATYRVLTVPPGEDSKSSGQAERLAEALVKEEAHRGTILIGIGGGMVTDLAGYVASVYMRGVAFGGVPSTLLGMVDAAVGGKNGVNLGVYKNMLGTVRQPHFVLHDAALLSTLPTEEWSNGFAEIIKYGCIADARILTTLLQSDIAYFQKTPEGLAELIAGCVDVKNKIVVADEDESGLRRILNFGHTAAHAFERMYGLAHGAAVGLGMLVACLVSERVAGLEPTAKDHIANLLDAYGLPTALDFDVAAVSALLRTDKKRSDDGIDYVVIGGFGKARTERIPFRVVEEALQTFKDASGR